MSKQNKQVIAAATTAAMLLIGTPFAQADFTLTDKNNANGVLIPSGNTAANSYIMETRDNAFLPSVPGATAGFRFNDQNSTPAFLLTAPNPLPDLRQGISQPLLGNAENGYVGTVVGKTWGNAVTLSFGNKYLTNGPGADLYITAKNVDASGIVQTTSTGDKSFSVGVHLLNGPQPGWHLYNPSALPTNFQPADGAGNVLGALDLSALPLSTGSFTNAQVGGITSFIPSNALIDYVVLVNSNAANAHAWGYLGTTAEAPTMFVARRDFDNADLDGNAFTGVDYLTARYGDRPTNGQDGPQAWFVGLTNTAPVPEPSTLGVLGLAALGFLARRRRRC